MDDFAICFNLFGFNIRWYSICIGIGILLGYLLLKSECKRLNIRSDFIFNLAFWTIIIGIICARVYFCLFYDFEYYISNPIEILKIWNGGLAIHGGIIGGLITIFIYCMKYKISFIRILDIFAPSVLIAQAVGRWGNFFNHEAYGIATTYNSLIDKKVIPQFVIDNMFIDGSYRMPTFYYESTLCLIGVLLILIIRRGKYVKYGTSTSLYLIWYGIIRFIIEGYRTDSLMIGELKIARIISIIFIVIGVLIILVVNGKPKLEGLYNEEFDEIKY